MKISIIGYGYVGKAYHNFFKRHYDVVVYDPYYKEHCDKSAFVCDMAVICVPTQQNEDGSGDITIVEDSIREVDAPLILIKSAVPPGTTDYLSKKYKKPICLSPEFIGEGNYFIPYWKYPHPSDATMHDFLIVGGPEPQRSQVIDVMLKILGPSCYIHKLTALEAELDKYMENCWGAMKVTFANEWYEIAKRFGADWHRLREAFLADGRTERMHTMVRPQARGYGGKCFPKDVRAIIYASNKKGYQPALLEEVDRSNNKFRKNADL